MPFPRNRFLQRGSSTAFLPTGVFPGEVYARSILNVRKLLFRARPHRRHRAMLKGISPSRVFPAMQKGFGVPRKHPTSKSNANWASTPLLPAICAGRSLLRAHRARSPNPEPRHTSSAPHFKPPPCPHRSPPIPSANLTQPQSPPVTREEGPGLPREDSCLIWGYHLPAHLGRSLAQALWG